MKNIIENIKLTISMIIIGALLLYIGTTVFMPELTIKIFQIKPYIVVTESMEPNFNVNDMVVATRFNIEEAEVGDIITFKADIDYNGTDEIVTHYIYSIDTSGEEAIIRTNRHFEEGETVTPDTWLIPASDVIGAVSFHVPYAGLVVGFIKSPFGIGIILLNIVIFSGIKYINKKSDRQEEQTNQNLDLENINNFDSNNSLLTNSH
ncbi:signal peptidase I [Candidatus Izimaplasma bacterium]|nr:signal peptidase I [Candidatus Izimaplasma bacterium]